jgi:esterase/lipase
MKNMIRNSVMVLASVFVINAVHAESDGGLMAEMMAKRFPAKVISDPAAQERLSQVQIRGQSEHNGGLMAELMSARYPVKTISNEAAQARLAQVNIPVGD